MRSGTARFRIRHHWLVGARRLLSPNRDARPDPADISLIVVHAASLPAGEFGNDYVSKLFQNQLDVRSHASFDTLKTLAVSSHVFINREGGCMQYVSFNERAWHAGVSVFQGRANCNDFAIGIELEGDDHTPYTEIQYSALAELVAALMAAYPAITDSRLVGHMDIAPMRKTDPGQHFNWQRLRARMRTLS